MRTHTGNSDVRYMRCWNQILKAFANNLDPDETPQNVASHQDPNRFLNDAFVRVKIGFIPASWSGRIGYSRDKLHSVSQPNFQMCKPLGRNQGRAPHWSMRGQ
ncbi:hypothetical protein DPMN_173685 [Dreissena polymorpha]|uniref:Uncharacterized protein n=1 Tax=Dreissena polymorpha TaxID=45954 RepID=A0A9D4E3X4_DREPO|nr:hypothetical protein DPMN_173685 [Dreissena polymorpha]